MNGILFIDFNLVTYYFLKSDWRKIVFVYHLIDAIRRDYLNTMETVAKTLQNNKTEQISEANNKPYQREHEKKVLTEFYVI